MFSIITDPIGVNSGVSVFREHKVPQGERSQNTNIYWFICICIVLGQHSGYLTNPVISQQEHLRFNPQVGWSGSLHILCYVCIGLLLVLWFPPKA